MTTSPTPRPWRRAIVAAATALAALTSVGAATAGDDGERIQFAAGSDSASVSGSIAPGTTARFVLRASAGQTMHVSVGPDNFAALTTVFGPGGDVVGAGHTTASANLPDTGDYVVEIGNTGTTSDFTVTITIPAASAPGTSDPVATTTTPPAAERYRLQFAPGTDSITLDQAVVPGGGADYIFRADAGQTVYVEVGPDDFAARTWIWGEGELASGDNSVSATLPESGDYVLGIDNVGTTTDFTITLRIPAQAAPPTTGACGVDPEASAITDNVDAVPPAEQAPGIPWTYVGESNYDRCADLSYAIVDVEGGTGSSPRHVMLFHRGAYIGTATECAFGFTSVTATTGNSVTVEFRWPREGDPNAAPSGSASTTFSWNGSDVVMSAELPDELLTVSGCDVAAPGGGGTPGTGDPAPGGTLPATR
jgi:hypothetical protein